MTVQEAKMQIQAIPSKIWEQLSPCDNEAMGIAIECMEEVEQYRALGTVEELKEAREKQVAKKPIIDEEMKAIEVYYWNCPSCNTRYGTGTDMIELQHCHVCGQALKWGEEDEMQRRSS